MKPSEPRKTEDPCTIRENEQLRNVFIKNVILPIQYVLQYGYQVTVQDMFSVPPAAKSFEATTLKRIKSQIAATYSSTHYKIGIVCALTLERTTVHFLADTVITMPILWAR